MEFFKKRFNRNFLIVSVTILLIMLFVYLTSWQRVTTIYGTYRFQNENYTIYMYFSRNSNNFRATRSHDGLEFETLATGTFELYDNNQFVFINHYNDDFKNFSVINRSLDILVIIGYQEYVFTRISGVIVMN